MHRLVMGADGCKSVASMHVSQVEPPQIGYISSRHCQFNTRSRLQEDRSKSRTILFASWRTKVARYLHRSPHGLTQSGSINLVSLAVSPLANLQLYGAHPIPRIHCMTCIGISHIHPCLPQCLYTYLQGYINNISSTSSLFNIINSFIYS